MRGASAPVPPAPLFFEPNHDDDTMIPSIEIHSVRATVTCGCGATCEVTLEAENGEIDSSTLDGDLYVEAEERNGWGDGGFCPACQGELDRDVAEVNAADAARLEGRAA